MVELLRGTPVASENGSRFAYTHAAHRTQILRAGRPRGLRHGQVNVVGDFPGQLPRAGLARNAGEASRHLHSRGQGKGRPVQRAERQEHQDAPLSD